MTKRNPISLIITLVILVFSTQQVQAKSLEDIVNGSHRSAEYKKRNVYRHPVETLKFFEVAPNHSVLEIWPGGGWYTEVLGPYLRDKGTLYTAHFSEQQTKPFFKNMRNNFIAKITSDKETYGDIKVTGLYPPFGDKSPAPQESVDRVLTFRNVHNWSKGGFDQEMFNLFFSVLKPGGLLGVVEHRAKPGTPFDKMIESGYMTEAYVIKLAENAGFELVEKSEINANPADSADHPKGVWSLPPTLRGGETQRAKYLKIGESDRMTLKFKKPEKK